MNQVAAEKKYRSSRNEFLPILFPRLFSLLGNIQLLLAQMTLSQKRKSRLEE
jgi:hypothetical protein